MNASCKIPCRLLFTAVLAFLAVGVTAKSQSPAGIPYPAGYREWVHIKTMLVGPQSEFFQTAGGIHHIYANTKALEGYATGKFPDGAILIFDLLDTKEKDGIIGEAGRQRIDVMLKDSSKFAKSGGWAFERFSGDSQTDRPLTEEHRTQCFTCHEQAQGHDFVFSSFHRK